MIHASSATVWARLVALLVVAIAISACSTTVPSGEQPPREQTKLEIKIKATDEVNLDAEGRAAPILVRAYELNRYEPLLAHWLLAGETSPEHIYTALRQLASELSTYVRASTRRPRQHPPYQHVNPYASFRELVSDVQALLNDVLVRSAQHIAVAERANGVRLASIDPAELQGYTSLVFAVAGHMPPDQLAQQFPARTKVGPSDRLADIIRSNLPGILLQALPVPPRQIPFNAGFVYFEVQQRGPLWEHLLKSGGLAMHVAGEFPGLRLELWGVRNK